MRYIYLFLAIDSACHCTLTIVKTGVITQVWNIIGEQFEIADEKRK